MLGTWQCEIAAGVHGQVPNPITLYRLNPFNYYRRIIINGKNNGVSVASAAALRRHRQGRSRQHRTCTRRPGLRKRVCCFNTCCPREHLQGRPQRGRCHYCCKQTAAKSDNASFWAFNGRSVSGMYAAAELESLATLFGDTYNHAAYVSHADERAARAQVLADHGCEA
eukprot:6174768-Pleurochrysis_carterae.AAC.2